MVGRCGVRRAVLLAAAISAQLGMVRAAARKGRLPVQDGDPSPRRLLEPARLVPLYDVRGGAAGSLRVGCGWHPGLRAHGVATVRDWGGGRGAEGPHHKGAVAQRTPTVRRTMRSCSSSSGLLGAAVNSASAPKGGLSSSRSLRCWLPCTGSAMVARKAVATGGWRNLITSLRGARSAAQRGRVARGHRGLVW